MHHPAAECPHWDYENHPQRKKILPAAAAQILGEIRLGTFDTPALLIDTRPIHRRLFSSLAPKHREYLAGHYRGDNFKCLRLCPVMIRSNPLVGAPPLSVKLEL